MSHIILVSMVRNESKIIARMLASALPVVDTVVLVDTGSTDDTKDKATTAISGIRTLRIAVRPWVDFSTNRNQALEAGRQCVQDEGWDPRQCWLLLLDADHILHASSNFNLDSISPSVDCISLFQEDSSLRYANPRLLRASAKAQYIGRTHEYLSVDGSSIRADFLSIEDKADGGCKADKYERDIALLTLDWNEKQDGRSAFYLAQTYRFMKQYKKSLEWYEKRIAIGQPHENEELWYSRLCMGRVLVEMGDMAHAQTEFAKAFAERPWRSESLQELAKLKISKKRYRDACLIAFMGSTVPMPSTDGLFIEKSVYAWDFTHNIMIAAYYIGDMANGRKACEILRLKRGSPYRDLALRNYTHYCEKIPSTVINIPFDPPVGWHACNPSIIKDSIGYTACVRAVNYTIKPGHVYEYPDGKVRTRNFLVKLDPGFKVLLSSELIQSPDQAFPSIVEGLEDVRIYHTNGEELFSLATSCDWAPMINNKRHMPRISRVTWDYAGKTLETKLAISRTPVTTCEKNWLPFVDKDRHLAIYSHDPFTVIDLDTNETIVQQRFDLMDICGFRGSSAPIRWEGGWLYSVHEVCSFGDGDDRKLFYMHRLCWMDDKYISKRISRPFYFDKLGVEFCAGMATHTDGIVMTFGVNDAEAKIAIVTRDTVTAWLAHYSADAALLKQHPH